MKKAIMIMVLAMFVVAPLYAQFGGIVEDPGQYMRDATELEQLETQQATNLQKLAEAVKIFTQLEQQYTAWKMQMEMLQHMNTYEIPSIIQSGLQAVDHYGNVSPYASASNTGAGVNGAYQGVTVGVQSYPSVSSLSVLGTTLEEARIAQIELADGSNESAISTIGTLHSQQATTDSQIANLQSDSLSTGAGVSSQLEVQEKNNAANVAAVEIANSANKLRMLELQQQVLASQRQRNADAASVNSSVTLQTSMPGNVNGSVSGMGSGFDSYTMP